MRAVSIHRLRCMRMLSLCLAAMLVFAAPLCARAQNLLPPSPRLAAVDLRAADLRFLLDAVASGTAEIRAGQLAIERSPSSGVRQLGRKLVRDHGKANARLLKIAHDKGVAVPRKPSEAQRGMLAALRGVQRSAFDQQFLERAGVHAHQEAIALFHAQVLRADPDPALKAFAASMLPVLQEHLRMAQALVAHEDASAPPASGPAADARETVADAAQVLREMKMDPQSAALLRRAHGILILPHYGRAALGVGLRVGQGVLVTRHGAGFSDPAFFRLGGISVGVQAGIAAGDVVYLLMSDPAVQQFRSNRSFSLAANAGLTVGSYSARRHASKGKLEDVVIWSGAHGAYAGGSLGISEVVPDTQANRAYYGRDVRPDEILGGLVVDPHPNVLAMVLGV